MNLQYGTQSVIISITPKPTDDADSWIWHGQSQSQGYIPCVVVLEWASSPGNRDPGSPFWQSNQVALIRVKLKLLKFVFVLFLDEEISGLSINTVDGGMECRIR